MDSLAEWEREIFVECTRECVAQSRVAGPKPKFTDEQARYARQLIDGGESIAAAARSLGVSRQMPYRALNRDLTTARDDEKEGIESCLGEPSKIL